MFALIAVLVFSSPPDPEVIRIQSHLRRVEFELRASGDAMLAPAARRWRARLLDELHRYWTRGRFPRNTYVDRRSPVFVDRSGTRCAVAQLIDASGRGDLVARVAAANNTAYLAELAGDAELVRWFDEHGLTAAEAARVQPTYSPTLQPAGEYCDLDSECESNLCIQVDEQLGYCTEPCADDGSCPAGREGIQMQCDASHPRHLCRYPSLIPGQLGWRCGQAPDSCFHVCLTDDPIPTCTYRCSNVADCPEDHECRSRDDTGGDAVCVAIEQAGDRCSLGGARSATGASALLALLVALRGRRPGRARSRCRRPS